MPLPPCVPTFHGSDPGMPSSTFRAHMARLSARWLGQTNPARSPHTIIMSKDATTASIPSQSQAQAIHLDMKQPIHLEKLTVELTERSTWLFSHLRFHFVASSHTFVAFRRAASGPFRKEKVAGKKEQTHNKEGLGGGTRWDSSGWKISRIDTVRARQEGRNVEHEANARARVPRMEGERECCSNARRRSTRWPRARLRSRRAVRHEPDLRLGKESEKPGCMRWFLRSIVRHFVVVEWTDQGCAFLESSWSTNGTDGRWWIAMVVCRYHPVGGALRCRLVAVAGCGGAQRCLGRERSTPCLRTRVCGHARPSHDQFHPP